MAMTDLNGYSLIFELYITFDSLSLGLSNQCVVLIRFFALTHVQLSAPGNSRHHLGRMLAVDLA